jgi:hypothetical protein
MENNFYKPLSKKSEEKGFWTLNEGNFATWAMDLSPSKHHSTA